MIIMMVEAMHFFLRGLPSFDSCKTLSLPYFYCHDEQSTLAKKEKSHSHENILLQSSKLKQQYELRKIIIIFNFILLARRGKTQEKA